MALVKFTRRQPRVFPGYASTVFPGLDDVDNRMSRFIERALNEPFGNALTESIGWLPAMDITESADELALTAEVPGMELKDIDLSIDDGVLTVRGEKMEERKEGEEKKFHLFERTYGSFQRSFALPATADASKINAMFDKGVLKVRIPKTPNAKANTRKIEIKAAP